MKRLFLLSLLVCGIYSSTYSQTVNTDSLWNIWSDSNQDDSLRCEALNEIIWSGLIWSNPDSAFRLSVQMYDLSQEMDSKKWESYAYNNLGICYYTSDDLGQSLSLLKKSLALKKEIKDKKGENQVTNNIGAIYKSLQQFDSAVFYFEESIGIDQKLGDVKSEHSGYSNLGTVYILLKMHKKNISLQKKALEYFSSISDFVEMGRCYQNIGASYLDMDLKSEVLQFFNLALGAYESGGDMIRYANVLDEISYFHLDREEYEQAIDYALKAIQTRGEHQIDFEVSTSLISLGGIYTYLGQFDQALNYLEKAMENAKKTRDGSAALSYYYAKAGTLLQMDQLDSALSYINDGIDLHFKMGQEVKPRFYSLKGSILSDLGSHDESIQTMQLAHNKILDYENSFSNHLISSYYNLATAYKNAEELETANKYFDTSMVKARAIGSLRLMERSSAMIYEIASIQKDENARLQTVKLIDSTLNRMIHINFGILSENAKEAYFNSVAKSYNYIFQDALNGGSTALAYNNILGIKNLLLKSSTAMRNKILNSDDELLIEEYENWIAIKRRVSSAYAEGQEANLLIEQADSIEKILVKKSRSFSEMNAMQMMDWKQVKEQLGKDEAAIEFIRFQYQSDFKNDETKKTIYAALVVKKNSIQPSMVELFEEKDLSLILGEFPGNNLQYIEQLYGTKNAKQHLLYQLIWKPLEVELSGINNISLSPDGLLHKISFSALTDEQNNYLSELFKLNIKNSTGNQIASSRFDLSEKRALLYGGIPYSSDTTRNKVWAYLEGTLKETEIIANIFKKEKVTYNYFKGEKATEASLKEKAENNAILHISTHGFFFPNPERLKSSMENDKEFISDISFRGVDNGLDSISQTSLYAQYSFLKNQEPLMRSGLAMAFANDVWQLEGSEDGNDGVLTAHEVATLDLRNTDLVVLSACETGLGDIKGSEGVYGLQRAFKMAGAKYLIMSLWQVPDKETAEFMELFYKNLIQLEDIPEAFNKTQKTMRKKYDPYYWAAFVLIH